MTIETRKWLILQKCSRSKERAVYGGSRTRGSMRVEMRKMTQRMTEWTSITSHSSDSLHHTVLLNKNSLLILILRVLFKLLKIGRQREGGRERQKEREKEEERGKTEKAKERIWIVLKAGVEYQSYKLKKSCYSESVAQISIRWADLSYSLYSLDGKTNYSNHQKSLPWPLLSPSGRLGAESG